MNGGSTPLVTSSAVVYRDLIPVVNFHSPCTLVYSWFDVCPCPVSSVAAVYVRRSSKSWLV